VKGGYAFGVSCGFALGWWNMHSRRIENVHFEFADLNQVWQACYSGLAGMLFHI